MDTNSLIHTDALKDKSLWLAVLTPLLLMGGKLLGVDLDAGTVATVVGPVVAFILSSKLKQAHISAAVVNAGLAKQADDAEALLKPAPVA